MLKRNGFSGEEVVRVMRSVSEGGRGARRMWVCDAVNGVIWMTWIMGEFERERGDGTYE